MPRIYITEPNHFYTYELPIVPGAEVRIGTAPHCQLALPGVAGLGEVHACIYCQPEGYVIADMGSPTGTFANGAPIQSEYLTPGVEYRLGAAVITLAAEGAPPQQAVPAQPAPAEAPAAQPQKPAAPKKASPLKTGLAAASVGKMAKKDLGNLASKYNRNSGKKSSQATFLYVIALLVVAFYAGIALHHWERTGNCLPGLVADEKDAPPAAKAPAPQPVGSTVETTEDSTPDAAPETDDTPEPQDATSTDEPTNADDAPAAEEPAEPEATESADEPPAEAADDAGSTESGE